MSQPMTSRERLLATLARKIPDCVPVCPDTSNMIPCRLTGLPFWDIYLYKKVPLWQAYINCVKHFGFDSLMDGIIPIEFDNLNLVEQPTKVIVQKTPERIVTQTYVETNGRKNWSKHVDIYHVSNSPNWSVLPEKIKLPKEPDHYTELGEVCEVPKGAELLKQIKNAMGDSGLVGVFCGTSLLIKREDDIYDYYDDPDKFIEMREKLLVQYEKRFTHLMSLDAKPDFICTGGSGTLIFQTPDVFRELGLPIVKKMTKLCKEYGIPSHIHSCGPEAQLVEICANETDLTVIDPLEISPMGNCNLKELKQKFGDKIVLKGNLHTTDVMLNGSVADVIEASKHAIDDAAEGGGFILSTGDQCGRDTPDENIFAMIETARTYGKY